MSYGVLLNSIPSNCKELLRMIETEEKMFSDSRVLSIFFRSL